MKKGDWVEVDSLDVLDEVIDRGGVGQITMLNYVAGYHLVNYQDGTFARLVHKGRMALLKPAVSDILNATYNKEI
jgi:hypothetical protein